MERKKLIVANWKMHLTVQQASTLLHRLHTNVPAHRSVEVVLAPSMLALQPLSVELDRRRFRLCAQNAYQIDEGPFTGEVSFAMLGELVHYCLVGHSARRKHFGETLAVVRDKVQAAIRNGISPIVCIGETKHERDAGESKRVIHDQITTALMNVASQDIDQIVIVYEPVWAISTNEAIAAKPNEVKTMIDYIRLQVYSLYGKQASENMRVLYGGSVDDQDAGAYLSIEGIDGVLVGAASLNYHQFASIVQTAHIMQTKA